MKKTTISGAVQIAENHVKSMVPGKDYRTLDMAWVWCVSPKTAQTRLSGLAEMGLVERRGATKNSRWVRVL